MWTSVAEMMMLNCPEPCLPTFHNAESGISSSRSISEAAVRQPPSDFHVNAEATGPSRRDSGMHWSVLRFRLLPAQFLTAWDAARVTVNSDAEAMVCFDTLSVTSSANLYRPGSNFESGKYRMIVACWPK